ncbi:MAG: FAD binding domain-containing protein [Sphingomonadales bacterium]
MSSIERYERPASVETAVEILRGGDVTVLAAGTDLMVQTQAGRVEFSGTLMNILHIPEMKGISVANGEIRLGALTTIAEFMESDIVTEHLPALFESGDCFASGQLRNAGTIGGNIMNASPAGDTLIPLLIYDAEVELASKADGGIDRRRVALRNFLTGPGKTSAKKPELLTAVFVPVPSAGQRSRFYKFGARPALDISTISIGLAAVPVDGALIDVRVAFGAVAPTPIRATATEAAIEGCPIDEPALDLIAKVARQDAAPIDDVRGSAWYRQELIHNVIKRMLRDVAQM